MHFCMIFAQYIDNHLKCFNENWSEVRQNGCKSDAEDYMVKFKPILKVFRLIDSKNHILNLLCFHLSDCY